MLVAHVRLRFGSYDAASDVDLGRAEWPPHPARVFCSLVAGDPSPSEWEALEWLECQGPPVVHAADLLGTAAPPQFVPTNAVANAGSTSLPGRTNAERVKPRAFPAETSFALSWPDAVPEPDVLSALGALADRVGYVGRSTASAEVQFTNNAPGVGTRYEPAGAADARDDFRVPYPGYCEQLRAAHQDGRRAWEVSRRQSYRKAGAVAVEEAAETLSSPYSRLLVFRFAHPAAVTADSVVALSERLRAATMSLMADPVPPVVSGHEADGRPHVAFLGLPNVGQPAQVPGGPKTSGVLNEHADGRLLAMGLAVPSDDEDLAVSLHRSLVSHDDHKGLEFLPVGPDADIVRLVYDPFGAGPRGAQADRWCEPSRLWATATPVVLDRFPKKGDVAKLVTEALLTAGYPAPAEVGASRAPILPGSPAMSARSVRRRHGAPLKPWVHAWARFDQPIAGPVLAGSMRYRGLGLFAPLHPAAMGTTDRPGLASDETP